MTWQYINTAVKSLNWPKKRGISKKKEKIHNPWETQLLKEKEVREEEGEDLKGEKVEEEVIFKDKNGFELALMEDTNHYL